MKNCDFTKIIKKIHQGKWIALTPGRYKVVDFDKDLMALKARVGKKKVVYYLNRLVTYPQIGFAKRLGIYYTNDSLIFENLIGENKYVKNLIYMSKCDFCNKEKDVCEMWDGRNICGACIALLPVN